MISAHEIADLPVQSIKAGLAGLSPAELEELLFSWQFWSRAEQREPEGDWTTWMYLAGRGAGKTRSGAEWVKNLALNYPGIRIAFAGPTNSDVRDTMIYGVSGLFSLHWEEGTRPIHVAGRRGIFWPNGSMAHTFSAQEPDRFRGPQFHAAWCDELAAWRYLDDCWDLLSLGTRLEYPGSSEFPRTYISTTPRPIELIKELLADTKTTVVTHGSTYSNRANLSAKFFESVVKKYEGTSYSRQEIYGELIDDLVGALWKRANILHCKLSEMPKLKKIVVAVDPAASDKMSANECGIILCGRGVDEEGYVLGDFTTHAQSPEVWGKKVVEVYKNSHANSVVIEGNLGGGLVEAVIRQIDRTIPLRFVQAKRGKYLRAEPVALLYEQHRVHHVGNFADLEDQMCRFTALYEKENPGLSPDRVDALVWGLAYLFLESQYDSSQRWVGG